MSVRRESSMALVTTCPFKRCGPRRSTAPSRRSPPVALDEVEDKEALHAASSPDDRIGELTTRNPFIELTGRSAAATAETHSDLRFGPVFELAAPVRRQPLVIRRVSIGRTSAGDLIATGWPGVSLR
jgi:hypothetical protein